MRKKFTAFLLIAIMVLFRGYTTYASENEWNILSGFGSVKATGTGQRTEEDQSQSFNGYGGLSYRAGAVSDAVAVQFQILAYPSASHYFYFGLLDAKGEEWNSIGNTAQGIISEIMIVDNGKRMELHAISKTASGTLAINNQFSNLKAMGTPHMLVMYKEADNWMFTLDGVIVAKVPVESTPLGEKAHLVAGSYGSSTMEMTINEVFLNGEVTEEMKDGTYIKELAGPEGMVSVYYDEYDRLVMGETTKSSTLIYEQPSYVVSEITIDETDGNLFFVLLGSGIALTVTLSVLMFLTEHKKKKETYAQEG